MATNEQNSRNTNTVSAAPAGKKSKTLLSIGLAALLAAGGAGWFFLGRKSVAAKNDAANSVTILHLDKFMVNLADTDREAYLRVGIDLSVAEPAKSSDDEVTEPLPEIRDAVLGVLTTCQSGDLLKPAGKKQLKQNLIDALNREVPGLGVRDVYFTDFLVQR